MLYKFTYQNEDKQQQRQKQEMKVAVAVRSHGDKKVQVELDKVLQAHLNGEAEVLYLDQTEIKIIQLR